MKSFENSENNLKTRSQLADFEFQKKIGSGAYSSVWKVKRK